MTKEIEVEIYGQLYRLRGDPDPVYVAQLARTVDAKMRTLAAQIGTLDTRRLAVLAALNLADELQQLHRKLEQERVGLPREFATRLAECNRLLAGALSGESSR